jgi:hypothetical protein
MRILRVAGALLIVGGMVAGCAASTGHSVSPDADAKVKAQRDAWGRCVLFTAANEAKEGLPSDAAAETVLRLCSDEEARYRKVLHAALPTSQEADAVAHEMHDKALAVTLGYIKRIRGE